MRILAWGSYSLFSFLRIFWRAGANGFNHSFDYVGLVWFLMDVCIRTQSAAVAIPLPTYPSNPLILNSCPIILDVPAGSGLPDRPGGHPLPALVSHCTGYSLRWVSLGLAGRGCQVPLLIFFSTSLIHWDRQILSLSTWKAKDFFILFHFQIQINLDLGFK